MSGEEHLPLQGGGAFVLKKTSSIRRCNVQLSITSINFLLQLLPITTSNKKKSLCLFMRIIVIICILAYLLCYLGFNEETTQLQKQISVKFYYLESLASGKENELWLNESATSLTDRIRLFNDALTVYRRKSLLKFVELPANETGSTNEVQSIAYDYGTDYFKKLRNLDLSSHLTTVFLKWIEIKNKTLKYSVDDENSENLLISKVYRWTGVKPPCLWADHMTQRTVIDVPYCQSKETYSSDVRINMTDILNYTLGKIDSAYQQRYSQEVDEFSPKYAFFVHIAKSATVTPDGVFYVKQTKIRLNSCSNAGGSVKEFQIYDEIYSIAMWAGESLYHWMIDSISRMAVLLDFLRKHPSIRIHLKIRNEQIEGVFRTLGLSPERIITGYAFGKVVYVPRATNCYEASLFDMQIMSHEYQKFIAQTSTNTLRNSVIYIRRTKNRRFADNAQIESMTKKFSEQYGLKFELFADDNLPSVNETMYMFYRARVIVAPHGAGLHNMQYSRPGTVIVEAVHYKCHCLCFLIMAHVLGHKHHGVGGTCTKSGTMDVNIADFVNSIEFHIKYAAEHKNIFNLNVNDRLI